MLPRRRRVSLAEQMIRRKKPRVLSLRRHPLLALALAYRVPLLILAALFFLITLWLIARPFARADVSLYPATCLGGWNNTSAAEGIPEVAGQSPAAYSEANAAFIGQAVGELFCGSFTNEDEASSTRPAWATLSLSIAAHAPPAPASIDESELATSTINQVLDAPADAAGAASSAPEVPADQSAPDAPSSLIERAAAAALAFVTPVAHAQEASGTPEVASDALLEVDYTLDGSTWQPLGTLTEAQLADARVSLPLGGIATLADLANLQIGVKRLSALADAPTIYLDGMTLAVGYASAPPPEKPVAPAVPFVRDDPSFDLANPVGFQVTFDPSPCTGSYWGFYWFGEGGVPHAFADLPRTDIGTDISHEFLSTSPFIELAGVIVSDKPFPMTTLRTDPSDALGVAWPDGVTVCTPGQNPLEGSAANPAERFNIITDTTP